MSYVATEQPGRTREIASDGRITARRTFVVQATARMDGSETITNLPERGDEWPNNSTLILQVITSTESQQLTAGGWAYTYDCEYRNFFDEEDGQNLTSPPLDRSAVWSWDSENFTETRFYDLDGKTYVNPVGDPFDPPPTFDVAHVIATVRKNYSTFSGGFALAYVNAVNHAAYAGASRGQVKIDKISSQPKNQDGVSYYETTLVLHYNPLGWNPHRELNQGPMFRKQVNGVWKKVYNTDSDGIVSTAMVLLNADGTRCSPGIFNWGDGTYMTPSYTEFRQYEYQNFTALNLY